MSQSRTDHWSKMKHQATNFVLKMPEAVAITKRMSCGQNRMLKCSSFFKLPTTVVLVT